MTKLAQSDRLSLDAIFKKNRTVGASTATISKGSLVKQEVFGLSNSRAGTDVEATTRF